MTTQFFSALIIVITMVFTGCIKDQDKPDVPEPAEGEFADYGFIPGAVDASKSTAEFQTAIYYDNHVFVATTDGVWKNNLTTKTWSRAGLDGKVITALYKHPAIAGKFFAGVRSDNTATFKTLYISSDGGSNWSAGNSPVFDNLENRYEDYVCFAARPDNPDHIYANLNGGSMIAVSTDGGYNWVRKNNETESYFGYQCNIAFLPADPDRIYQGSENPLDIAWLGRYDIDDSHPEMLSNFSKVVDNTIWGNRRPDELRTYSYTGNNIYVGQEGALSVVTGSTSRFIYKSENDNFPYSYIYAIWVDPANTNHLIFGGAQNGGNDMNLYETFDEGNTIVRFTDKMGFTTPDIREIISTDTYPAIIINDDGENKVKLYLYNPGQTK